MKTFETAVIVGASSGIGAELAKVLASEGCRVAVVARRLDRLEALAAGFPGKIFPYAHDVTHVEEIPELLQRIAKDIGGVDLFVYSSGVMPKVGLDEFNTELDQAMIDVNFTGAVAWCNAAMTRFQSTGQGTLVGIGSVAGERGRRGQPVYNATKAAFHSYLEALRNRAKPGVKIVTIKPGPTDTEMVVGLQLRAKLMPAPVAALKIRKKLERDGEHFLKFSHWVIFGIIRNIPSFLFRKIPI